MTGLTVMTNYYVRAYAINSVGISYGNEITFNSGRTFGTEYRGGYVFYNFGNRLVLIAAYNDLETGWWSSVDDILLGTTDTVIGTGLTNSERIQQQHGINGSSAAAKCLSYDDETYDNWYLPSKDELQLMWWNLVSDHSSDNAGRGKPHAGSIGNFIEGYYQSSSEYNAEYAWKQSFANGNQLGYMAYKSTQNVNIRPIRSSM